MNRHQLTCVDLHPAPVEREPSTLAILASATVLMLTLWGVIFFILSL